MKQQSGRPDLVEFHDTCSPDPHLLVCLKGVRNAVQVPRHWISKRKYLQGKRGIEKPPFDLPDFIKATGIMEMRQAVQEKVLHPHCPPCPALFPLFSVHYSQFCDFHFSLPSDFSFLR